ncbi:hypothetical protein [Streptomyces sp. NPDC001450]
MSEPSQTPDPSYTKVQLSGPPEAVARLIAALGVAGAIVPARGAGPPDAPSGIRLAGAFGRPLFAGPAESGAQVLKDLPVSCRQMG